jgi:flagellar biosynthetic protein FlhB
MADDDAERTEPATPKRREDVRKKGDVAQSREVGSALILLAVLLACLSPLGAGVVVAVASLARAVWSGAVITPGNLADYHAVWLEHVAVLSAALLPLLLVILVAGTVGSAVQVGPLFSLEAMQPRLDRLSLVKGLKRMASLDRLFDLGKALVKIGVAVLVSWLVLGPQLEAILALGESELRDALALAALLIRRLTIGILVGFGAFALLDLLYTRFRYEKKLRMTRQEVRDEQKQREGDPKVKAQLRARARELTRLRMIGAVAQADVVVTNPTHYAVALRYARESMAAPQVVAKGRNKLALRIRERARQAEVPIVENPPLAQLLYKTAPLGREIPESLYRAVAEVLAYITRLDPRRAEAWRRAS